MRTLSESETQMAYDSRSFQQKFNVGNTKMHAEIGAGRLKVKYLGRKLLIMHDDAIAWLAGLPERSSRREAA